MEHHESIDSLAIEVVGQNWSSEVISLFLEDWEVRRVVACRTSSVSGFSSLPVFGVRGIEDEVF